jgi:hypothetical protein
MVSVSGKVKEHLAGFPNLAINYCVYYGLNMPSPKFMVMVLTNR